MLDFVRLKISFLTWFLMMLAASVGIFFSWRAGYAGPMATIDHTHVTWLIAGVVAITSLWIGLLTWRLEEQTLPHVHLNSLWHQAYALGFLIFLGIVGSTLGFYLQSASLVSGTASLQALGTGVLSTCFAAMGAAFITIQSFNLHYGVEKLRVIQRYNEAIDAAIQRTVERAVQ